MEKRDIMSYRTIKDLTRSTGVTESALRYYDEKRLLQPTIKSQTGRREWLYDEEAVRKLQQILLFKRMGLSTERIGAMFEEGSEAREKIMKDHLDSLRTRRNELDRQIAAGELMRLIEAVSEGDSCLKTKLVEEFSRQVMGQEDDSGGSGNDDDDDAKE